MPDDEQRTTEERIGAARAFFKADMAGHAPFHPKYHEALLAAWQKGQAFFDGEDIFGCPLSVKLGDVNMIALTTPASIALYQGDEEIMLRREKERDITG